MQWSCVMSHFSYSLKTVMTKILLICWKHFLDKSIDIVIADLGNFLLEALLTLRLILNCCYSWIQAFLITLLLSEKVKFWLLVIICSLFYSFFYWRPFWTNTFWILDKYIFNLTKFIFINDRNMQKYSDNMQPFLLTSAFFTGGRGYQSSLLSWTHKLPPDVLHHIHNYSVSSIINF